MAEENKDIMTGVVEADGVKGFMSHHTTMEYDKFAGDLMPLYSQHKQNVATGAPTSRTRERISNVLMNNLDLIVDMYNEFTYVRKIVQDDGEELESLRAAIKAGDDQFNELNRKYKALLAETEQSGVAKTKRAK